MPRIGFVGLGTMGGAMAGHLHLAGLDLMVWNRSPERTERLRSQGVAVAESLEAVGSDCDQVFLCVRGTSDVRECLEGLTGTAKEGALFVDHSTILPQAAADLHGELRQRGFRFIDAPMTGGSMGAEKGSLTVFCGGEAADIEEARGAMSTYAKRIERVGGPGTGQLMKAANQIAVAGSLLALCEGLAFAKKAGLDIAQTRELLSLGAAGSWAFENYGPKILAGDWTPGFSVDNQIKDLQYCEEAASQVGAFIPGAALVYRLLREMSAEGSGGLTTAALYEKLLARSG